ncbi:hypothetical protein SELMODRAFT_412290 [Selaginella moellendorffii]|uniref:Peptidase S26 domain-containing protein n=1 Tax=Selaginella moellendorffii TaxID=88036 RepID=D8RKN7_SELML|nr:hypothetical protein SELMODRAFT_412290 [Selaginella moellendorffii]
MALTGIALLNLANLGMCCMNKFQASGFSEGKVLRRFCASSKLSFISSKPKTFHFILESNISRAAIARKHGVPGDHVSIPGPVKYFLLLNARRETRIIQETTLHAGIAWNNRKVSSTRPRSACALHGAVPRHDVQFRYSIEEELEGSLCRRSSDFQVPELNLHLVKWNAETTQNA